MKNDLSQAFLIVDGHNLAYLLFDFKPGARLSPEIAERMAKFFSAYRAEFEGSAPQIELCFDGGVRPGSPDPEGVRILAAGHHNKADHLILDRFRVHQFFGQPCLAISNDMGVLDRIEQEGGATLKAFDLVLLRHPQRPIFMAPLELIAKFPDQHRKKRHKLIDEAIMDVNWRVRALKSDRITLPKQQLGRRAESPPPPPSKGGQEKIGAIPGAPFRDRGVSNSCPPFEGGGGGDSSTSAQLPPAENGETSPLPSEPHYTLTLANWPVVAGVKFLMSSFCKQHRPEFSGLVDPGNLSQLRSDDLIVLADFLRDRCSQEPSFAQQGSLMDRVRLALLKAGPDGLSLSQLAAETGLPLKGLQGRIKGKADRWLKIIESHSI
jgi:hypothetical protein